MHSWCVTRAHSRCSAWCAQSADAAVLDKSRWAAASSSLSMHSQAMRRDACWGAMEAGKEEGGDALPVGQRSPGWHALPALESGECCGKPQQTVLGRNKPPSTRVIHLVPALVQVLHNTTTARARLFPSAWSRQRPGLPEEQDQHARTPLACKLPRSSSGHGQRCSACVFMCRPCGPPAGFAARAKPCHAHAKHQWQLGGAHLMPHSQRTHRTRCAPCQPERRRLQPGSARPGARAFAARASGQYARNSTSLAAPATGSLGIS